MNPVWIVVIMAFVLVSLTIGLAVVDPPTRERI